MQSSNPSPSDYDSNGCIESTRKITQLITVAYQGNANLLIAGDFNYKHIDWTNEYAPPEQEYLLNFIETLIYPKLWVNEAKCLLRQSVSKTSWIVIWERWMKKN